MIAILVDVMHTHFPFLEQSVVQLTQKLIYYTELGILNQLSNCSRQEIGFTMNAQCTCLSSYNYVIQILGA